MTSNIVLNNTKVNDISVLRTVMPTSPTGLISVDHYNTLGDGGGGIFSWDSSSVAADNGGTIIAPTGVSTGRWKRVFDNKINVKWFGAKADGTTDDGSAIRNALAAASGVSKTSLYFPAGTYAISTQDGSSGALVNVNVNNVNFVGDGASTIIKATVVSYNVFTLANNVVNINFDSMQIWGAATLESTTQFGIFTNSSSSVQNVNINNVIFTGPSLGTGLNNGIKINSGLDWKITNCSFQYLIGADGTIGSGYGVLTGSSTRVLVHGCSFLGDTATSPPRGRHAVYLSAGTSYCVCSDNMVDGLNENAFNQVAYSFESENHHNRIQGNVIKNGGRFTGDAAAIGLYGLMSDITIVGNTISGFKGHGIITSAHGQGSGLIKNNRVVGNTIDSCSWHGIFIYGAFDTTVMNNSVRDCGLAASGTYSGILVLSYYLSPTSVATNTRIIGNTAYITDTSDQLAAFHVNGTSPAPVGTIVQGNNFPKCGTYGVHIEPAATISTAYNNIDTVDVKDYGAVGDGAVDDADAIDRAIQAAGNKRCHFPDGTYLTSRTINILTSKVTLHGNGDTSIIRTASVSFDIFIVQSSDVVFDGLYLQGAAVDNTTTQRAIKSNTLSGYIAGTTNNFAGILNGETLVLNIDGTGNVTITFQTGDTTIEKVLTRINTAMAAFNNDFLYVAIYHSNGTDLALISPICGNQSSVQVVSGTALVKLGLTATTATGSPSTGTHGRPQRITVRNVHFGGPSATVGLNNALAWVSGCDDWTVENCRFELIGFDGNTGNGYGMNVGGRRALITKNTFIGSTHGGRHLCYIGGGARDCIVSYNQIFNCNSNSINSFAPSSDRPCVNNQFVGNMCVNQVHTGTNNAAISVDAGQKYVTIRDNQIIDCGDYGIYFSGFSAPEGGLATPYGFLVKNNSIVRAGQHAIFCENSQKSDIEGNYIENAGTAVPGGWAAIRLNAYGSSSARSHNVSIRNNRITGTLHKTGIELDVGALGPVQSEIADNIIDPGSGASGASAYMIFDSSVNHVTVLRNRADHEQTYTSGDTTPDVAGASHLSITNSGATTITNLANGLENQFITLLFNDSNTTIQDNSNIRLQHDADYNFSTNGTLTLQNLSGKWYEVSRTDDILVGPFALPGSPLAHTGDIRAASNRTILAVRNSGNTNDAIILSTDNGDDLNIGSAGSAGFASIFLSCTQFNFREGIGIQPTLQLNCNAGGASSLIWDAAAIIPTFKQVDQTTNSTNGAVFTIQAQNATGTTATGGALSLTSGTGTTAAGNVLLKTGGTTRLTVAPTSVTTSVPLVLEGTNTAGSGDIRAAGNTTVLASRNVGNTGDLSLITTDSADELIIGDTTNVVATQIKGNTSTTIISPFTAFGQSPSGATGLTITPLATGNTSITFATGVTSSLISQADKTTNGGTGATLTIQAQNETGTTSTGGNLVFTSGTGTSVAGNILFETGGSQKFAVTPTSLSSIAPLFQFNLTAANPTINQDNITTNGIGGQTFTIQAQNATGTTSTGGNLVLTSGTGNSVNGNVSLQSGGTTIASVTPSKWITAKGRRRNVTSVSIAYQVLVTDDIVSVGTLSAGITVTLPASPTTGDTYDIVDSVGTAASKNITVDGNGANINANSTFVINQNYGDLTVVFTGSIWSVL